MRYAILMTCKWTRSGYLFPTIFDVKEDAEKKSKSLSNENNNATVVLIQSL